MLLNVRLLNTAKQTHHFRHAKYFLEFCFVFTEYKRIINEEKFTVKILIILNEIKPTPKSPQKILIQVKNHAVTVKIFTA